jgi:hypothetical protein
MGVRVDLEGLLRGAVEKTAIPNELILPRPAPKPALERVCGDVLGEE